MKLLSISSIKKQTFNRVYLSFVFIYLFTSLVILKPFGIKGSDLGFILIISGYPLTGLIILYFLRIYILPKISKSANDKYIYLSGILLELIGLIIGIFLYAKIIFLVFNNFRGYQFPNPSLGGMAIKVFSLMIVPYTFLYIINHFQDIFQIPNKKLTLRSANSKEWLSIQPAKIILVKAEGNYICVHYILEEKLKKKLLRATLRSTKMQLKNYPSIQQVHKSYLVNLDYLVMIEKQNSKKFMTLDFNLKIPVTKNFKINWYNQKHFHHIQG